MYDGFVGKLVPGTRCIINGILKTTHKGKNVILDLFVDVCGIEFVNNESDGLVISKDEEALIHDIAQSSDIISRLIQFDGRQLAEYLIDFDIGVSKEAEYVVKKIDFDYFEGD